MKFLPCILTTLLLCFHIHAQETAATPVATPPADTAAIRARYVHETKYIRAILTLREDSTYSYTFTGCSWWRKERGKWTIKRNQVLVLKVGTIASEKHPDKRISLRRHRLKCSEDVVTASVVFQRDKAIPFVNLLKPEPVAPPKVEEPKVVKPEKVKPEKPDAEEIHEKCGFVNYRDSIDRVNVLCKCSELISTGLLIDTIRTHWGLGKFDLLFYYPLLKGEDGKVLYQAGTTGDKNRLFVFDGVKFSFVSEKQLFPGDGEEISLEGFNKKKLDKLIGNLLDEDSYGFHGDGYTF